MLQLKNLASRKKCGINIEEGVFDRRGNQDNVALFHIGQQCILLEFVEPVYLVEKEDGAYSFCLAIPCELPPVAPSESPFFARVWSNWARAASRLAFATFRCGAAARAVVTNSSRVIAGSAGAAAVAGDGGGDDPVSWAQAPAPASTMNRDKETFHIQLCSFCMTTR